MTPAHKSRDAGRGVSRAQLARLGLETADRAGAGQWLHRLALVGATFTAALIVAVFLAAAGTYRGVESRIAARTPVAASSAASGEAEVFPALDSWHDRQFAVVYLAPRSGAQAPPPGLAGWPKPGQVFLSPALLAADQDHVLTARYGTFAGRIGNAGLTDPGEWFAYVGTTPGVFGTGDGDSAMSVSGFGVPAGPSGDPKQVGGFSEEYDQSFGTFMWLAIITLVLPGAAWLILAARSGAAARDRRLALIHALGGTAAHLRWIVIGEAAPWVAIGALGGTALASGLLWLAPPLPSVHFALLSSDTRGEILPELVAGLCVMLGALLLCALLHRRPTPRSVRPIAPPTELATWKLLLVVFVYGIAAWSGSFNGNSLTPPAMLGIVLALAVTPLFAGYLLGKVGTVAVRYSRWRSRPAGLVGFSWLRHRPQTAGRMAASLIIGVGLIGQVQVAISRLDAPARAQAHVASANAGADVVVVAPGGASPAEVGRLTTTLSGAAVLVGNVTPQGVLDLSGTCASLRGFGAASCPTQPTDTSATAVGLATPAWSAIVLAANQTGAGSASIRAARPAGGAQVFVVAPTASVSQDSIEQAAYAVLNVAFVDTQADVMLDGVSQRPALGGWLIAFGLAGLMLVLLAAGLAWLGIILEQSRALAAIGAMSGGRQVQYRIAASAVAVPLAGATLLAAVADVILGKVQLDGGSGVGVLSTSGAAFSYGVLAAAVAACGAVVLVLWIVGGEAIHRAANAWSPHGD